MTPEERLERYARLAVEVGANVGEGQVVWLTGAPEHAPLVRAIARCAYERGARYVDVDYQDPYVRHARIEHAPDEALGWTPPWVLARLDYIAAERGALIQVIGDPDPELMADLDGTRVGKTRMLELSERYMDATNKRLINWTIVGCPTEGWARASSASPTWSGSGTRSSTRPGSTSRIPSTRGGGTSTRSWNERHCWTSGASTRCASAGPAPT